MKRLLLIVLPLLLIVGCSKVEGQQQLIPFVEKKENGSIEITYYKKTQNGIEMVKKEGYWRNGQKEFKKNYKDGELNGLYTWFHENGQKKTERTYKNGEYDGLETKWYSNGQKQEESTYKDGKEISWKRWNQDGSVRE